MAVVIMSCKKLSFIIHYSMGCIWNRV